MKTTFTYIAIVTLLLAIVVGLIYRGTRSPVLDVDQAASLFGKGMPPSLMTPPANTQTSTDELSLLMEQIQESIKPESWLQSGGRSLNVASGDLIEVDERKGEYTLSITLLWRDQEISTQRRYFISYEGPDRQIEGRPCEYLGCTVSSRGFLSGNCECTGISSTKVAVNTNWTFDDSDNNVISKFEQSFVATLNGNGSVDCENDATIKWSLENKVTQASKTNSPSGAGLDK